MKLIGLNGRKWSGKDTAYLILERIVKESGGRAQRICFADKMKYSGMRALGFDPPSVAAAVAQADLLKEHGFVTTTWKRGHSISISGRKFWQRYGTEAHREVFGDDFWVDVLLPVPKFDVFDATQHHNQATLERLFPDVDVLIETTTRFPNEANRILALGGQVWKIDADQRLGPLPEGSHVSEHGLPDELTTMTIPNNGTPEQFEVAVAAAWRLSLG